MSALLTPEMCHKAWYTIEVAVDAAADDGMINKFAGTIVVLDPTSGGNADSSVLFKKTLSRDHENAAKYEEFALAKARLSHRTGRSSRDIQVNAPHLFKEPYSHEVGDLKWGGSVVREGLIVAFSGVEAVFDEMIAGWMADALIAMCRHEMTRPDGIMASDDSYIDRNRNGKLAHLVG